MEAHPSFRLATHDIAASIDGHFTPMVGAVSFAGNLGGCLRYVRNGAGHHVHFLWLRIRRGYGFFTETGVFFEPLHEHDAIVR